MSDQLKVTEFKDVQNKHRVRVRHINGNVMHSSTQGYSNLKECIHGSVSSAIALIDEYRLKTQNQIIAWRWKISVNRVIINSIYLKPYNQ